MAIVGGVIIVSPATIHLLWTLGRIVRSANSRGQRFCFSRPEEQRDDVATKVKYGVVE